MIDRLGVLRRRVDNDADDERRRRLQRDASQGVVRSRRSSRPSPVQRTYEVGPADDPLEREAERMGSHVERLLGGQAAGHDSAGVPTPSKIRRATAAMPSSAITPPATRVALRSSPEAPSEVGRDGGAVPADIEQRIRRGGGEPLDGRIRPQLESVLGHDFGAVRIHRNSSDAPRIGAKAFTIGNHVHFAPGEYDPSSSSGRNTLGHELTHVVQQGGTTEAGARVGRSSEALPVQRLFNAGARKHLKRNTYPKIEQVVALAQQGAATEKQILTALKDVRRHEKEATKMKDQAAGADCLDTLRVLGDELGIARDRLSVASAQQQAKNIYVEEARSGGLKALSQGSQGTFGAGAANTERAADAHGLDFGEAAALTTYTADDYRYINPAAAFNKGWMQKQMQQEGQQGTERDRFEEGGLHSAMMMQAFAKLPVWQGPGFRGERMSPTDFAQRFDEHADGTVTARNPTEVKSAFWSVSTKRAVGQQFANGMQSGSDQTVSILYVIDVTDARDLKQFSAAAAEAEVLCPAGSNVTVTKVVKQPTGKPGNPAATAWYEVHLKQSFS